MVRENLDRIPQFALPASFGLHWYQSGDEAHWLSIHLAADRLNQITPDLFEQQFGGDEALLKQRQCYLLSGKEPIGTATAWFSNDFRGKPYGRVHWVAILPEFQKRGLSKPLMTTICERLQQLGHERAYLTTSTERVAAIHLYRQFGFVPLS